jgi:hypothetical protein
MEINSIPFLYANLPEVKLNQNSPRHRSIAPGHRYGPGLLVRDLNELFVRHLVFEIVMHGRIVHIFSFAKTKSSTQ